MRTHGRIATYMTGCRCEPCRLAAREKKARLRAGGQVDPDERTLWEQEQRRRLERIRDGLIRVFATEPWRERAACKGKTHLFFGPDYERPDKREAREGAALAICAGCPVSVECRDAGRRGREFGVWGETELDRAEAGFADARVTRRDLRRAVQYAREEAEVHRT